MAEPSDNSDSPAEADGDDDCDSPVLDQEDCQGEVEVDGEEESRDGEEEDVKVDEDERGDTKEEEAEEMDEGLDGEKGKLQRVEEDEEEGGDGEELEVDEAEDGGGGDVRVEEVEQEKEIEEKEDGDGGREDVAGTDSVEAAIPVLEDANDLYKMVKSGGCENQNSVSSNARDCNAGKHHVEDPYSMGFNCPTVGHVGSATVAKHIPSKENEFLKNLVGETFEGTQQEMEISNKAPKCVKNNYLETHGDKGESHLHGKNDSRMLENSNLMGGHTSRRRPRSSSPAAKPDKMYKKPAITCIFYARGRCIKGKSCKFIHQKDGVNIIEQQAKEDNAGRSRKSDSICTTGSEEIVEGSKMSASLLDSSNAEGSSECNPHLPRASFRTYGAGSHVPFQFHENYNMLVKPGSKQPDRFQADRTVDHEAYVTPLGNKGLFDTVVERQFSYDIFLSRRHMIEGKLINEIPRDASLCERTSSKRTSSVDAFVPEYRQYSCSPSIASSMHKKSNSLFAYERTVDIAIKDAHYHLPIRESYTSHGLAISLSSGLNSSFPLSQSDHRLSSAGTSLINGSTPITEYLEGQISLDLYGGIHNSRSVSLSRDSSPCHSRPELQNMTHHIPGNLPYSCQKTKIQFNDWEPSQPFRPTLAIVTKSISSHGSQYDPILDSIEPPGTSARDYYFQTSQMPSFQNTSCQPTNTDTILRTGGSAASQTCVGILAKNAYLHDSSAHAAVDVLSGSIKLEGRNSSVLSNEKVLNHDRFTERLNIKDVELGDERKNQVGKSKINKESKALKVFNAALVDFVKELVKPRWLEGQLNKDAHNRIVKKSVEKVLSVLQPHKAPGTPEAIKQYLTTYKSKLLKLVEGYVQKYAKS